MAQTNEDESQLIMLIESRLHALRKMSSAHELLQWLDPKTWTSAGFAALFWENTMSRRDANAEIVRRTLLTNFYRHLGQAIEKAKPPPKT